VTVIEAVHIPDITRLVKPAPSADERREPQRRRQQQHHHNDDVPTAKVYALNGQVEEPEVENLPRIDLVG
jgi:hypothetical protein